MRKVLLFAVVSLLLLSCGRKGRSGEGEAFRGIYYWKTDFVITPSDSAFLSAHRIDRIYLRFFDVILSNKAITGYTGPVPNATVTFSSPKPESIEIVPVVFITLEALKDMTVSGRTGESAGKIFSRIDAMCRSHGLGPLREIQIDCDWTITTRRSYFDFLSTLRNLAHDQRLQLSTTIRFHQLTQPVPPADRGVLMVYNTGDVTRLDCEKPILNLDDVKPYVHHLDDYHLPLSAAYPLFTWRVLFRGGKEEAIRKKLLEDDNIDAVIGLPANLFYSTGIPVCILVLKKCRKNDKILFINASGEEHYEKGKRQNYLRDEDVKKIVETYQFRKEETRFSRLVSLQEIKENDYNLNITRYVNLSKDEEPIDLEAVTKQLKECDDKIAEAQDKLNVFLKELGLEEI